MGFIETYFQYQRHFEHKYGNAVVTLIRKGKFYECYQYIPELEGHTVTIEGNAQLKFKNQAQDSLGKAVEISLLLNMKLTSTDKNKPHSINNPLMVGFPPPNYDQHKDIILMHGYTIVRIDQKEGGGKEVEREVTEIISPGTGLDTPIMDYQPTKTNSIVSLYFELKRAPRNRPERAQVLCGMSCIDVSTGKSIIYEIYSQDNNEVYVVQETYRFLSAQRPVDIIVHIKGSDELATKYMRYLHEQLNLEHYPTRVVRCNQLDHNFSTDHYQEAVFNKAFGSGGIQQGTTNFIYQLDLELFEYGRISYVVLLQYCYEHNEMLIKRLQKPHVGWADQSKYLILTHDAAQQLDFFPHVSDPFARNSGEYDSLISVLDITSTAIGSRYLRRALLNPITDVSKLCDRYNMTEELLNTPELLTQLDLNLKQLPDIERLQRKIQIGIIKPAELSTLFNGYSILQEVYILLFKACFESEMPKQSLPKLFITEAAINDFNSTLMETHAKFNFNKLRKVKLTTLQKRQALECPESFVNAGQDAELDQLQTQLHQYQQRLNMIVEHLNNLLAGTRGKGVKIEDDRQDGQIVSIALETTSAKARQLKSAQYNMQLCGNLDFENNRSKALLTSQVIDQVTQGIVQCRQYLEQRLLMIYNQTINELAERIYFRELNRFVAQLDFIKTNAQLALKYNYFKPEIDTEATQAYFEIKAGRHPLVERIISMEYISNDLSLGHDHAPADRNPADHSSAHRNPAGLLLYGFNSAGKSCLAKMAATVINMAQTGLYVPAKLKYHPFTQIITRLTGQDNLIKGKSSFVVEATEIRTILRNADQNTLVLGDELCSTTETDSGTSIAAVTINKMIARGTKFIFATHMHHLPKVKSIKQHVESGQLRVAHLTATYDEVEEELVYNRKMAEGSGSSQYGLEVCKSLGFDRDFLNDANGVRREIEQTPELFMNTKKSKYNRKIYVDQCSICQTHLNLQTHHLKEQHQADERGYIEHYHKNAAYNLLVICSKCHQRVHQMQELSMTQTLEGVRLKR